MTVHEDGVTAREDGMATRAGDTATRTGTAKDRNNIQGGILLVNKPAGITSFLVVSKARRIYGLRRVGHCGTLDPFADGLLPIVIGRATRAVAYMDQYDKVYQVRIRFGRETDTLDHTGATTAERALTEAELDQLEAAGFEPVRAAIRDLVNLKEQLPPIYSAIKVDGQPLYSYARAGKAVERRSRTVTVHAAEPLAVVRDAAGLYADARIHCAKGTYIRSLAEAVGRTTGLLAHAETLTRLQTGPFTLAEAHGWDEITAAVDAHAPLPLLPVERAFVNYDRVTLDGDAARRLIQGQIVALPGATEPVGAAGATESDEAAGATEPAEPTEPAGAAEPLLVTVFGPSGFIGLGHVIVHEGGQRLLAAERMFADLENHRE